MKRPRVTSWGIFSDSLKALQIGKKEDGAGRSMSGDYFEQLTLKCLLSENKVPSNLIRTTRRGEKPEDWPKRCCPDFVIGPQPSCNSLLFLGFKTSFRERWKQDDRDAGVLKRLYPGVPFYLVTLWERPDNPKKPEVPKWTPEQQKRYEDNVRNDLEFAKGVIGLNCEENWNRFLDLIVWAVGTWQEPKEQRNGQEADGG